MKKNKYLIPTLVLSFILLVVILFAALSSRPNKFQFKNNWVSISYGALVEKSVLTHSGEAVGKVVSKIVDFSDENKGLVQQYLEPYSILCHDILLFINGPDTLPLVNITAHFPVGSEQPAWASLFREGHFQLYYNDSLIRLFIKGKNPKRALNKYRSIVRHSIQDVIERYGDTLKRIEVYAFKNDYLKMQIELNTIPAVFAVDELDLSPIYIPVDLVGIEDLLAQSARSHLI